MSVELTLGSGTMTTFYANTFGNIINNGMIAPNGTLSVDPMPIPGYQSCDEGCVIWDMLYPM
jgi:hypothetical protein